jgi:molybdenum cofactor cytidylyltransferase
MASSLVPIILAAGASSRMGRPKPLLDLGGKPALARVLEACRGAALSRPIVVLGHDADGIRRGIDLSRETLVLNPHPELGMASSLREGLNALPKEARGFLIYPADYPLVTWKELVLLEERFEHDHRHHVFIPTFEGKRGHPVACDRALADEFLTLPPESPAHLVIRKDPARVQEVPVKNPWVAKDLNTKEDYQAVEDTVKASSDIAERHGDR